MSVPNLRNQIKIVFFDIDETLYVKFKDYLPGSVRTVFRKLKENGIIPAIASGRSMSSFPVKLNALLKEEPITTMVTMNGQYSIHEGKVVEKHPIPTEKIRKLVNFFDQNGILYAFVSQDDVAISGRSPQQESALNPILLNYIEDRDYYKHHEVFQMLPFYDASRDGLVENAGILDGLRVVRWDKDSVDLFDKQGSKARGIIGMANYLGLKMENVMAFGDGLNDIEMLQTVGVGVAMGNASEQLKAVADYVTDHIEQDGIYNFLVKAKLI